MRRRSVPSAYNRSVSPTEVVKITQTIAHFQLIRVINVVNAFISMMMVFVGSIMRVILVVVFVIVARWNWAAVQVFTTRLHSSVHRSLINSRSDLHVVGQAVRWSQKTIDWIDSTALTIWWLKWRVEDVTVLITLMLSSCGDATIMMMLFVG